MKKLNRFEVVERNGNITVTKPAQFSTNGYFKFDKNSPVGFRSTTAREFINDLPSPIPSANHVLGFTQSGDIVTSDGNKTVVLPSSRVDGHVLTSDLSESTKMKWAPWNNNQTVEEILSAGFATPLPINTTGISILNTQNEGGLFTLARGIHGITKTIQLRSDARHVAVITTKPSGTFILSMLYPSITLRYEASDASNPYWRVINGPSNSLVSEISDNVQATPIPGQKQGISVALNSTGKHLIIGAVNYIYESVYNDIMQTWSTPIEYLSPIGPEYNWGSSVGITPDALTIIIGANHPSGAGSGSIWIGSRSNITELFTFTQITNYLPNGAMLGTSVAIIPDMFVAGAPGTTYLPDTKTGAVLVGRKISNVWGITNTISPANTYIRSFGYSVSISDDGTTIAVGAPDSTPNGTAIACGEILTHILSGDTWVSTAIIESELILGNTSPYTQNISRIGESVSISADGTKLVVGAPNYENVLICVHYPFWRVENVLNRESSLSFGKAVKISSDGNTIIISASPTSTITNVVAIYTKIGTWILQRIISVTVGESTFPSRMSFGTTLAASSSCNIVASGCPNNTDTSGNIIILR